MKLTDVEFEQPIWENLFNKSHLTDHILFKYFIIQLLQNYSFLNLMYYFFYLTLA